MASHILTFEGVVEHGQIRLPAQVHLPEGAREFILVPDMRAPAEGHLYSPRLKYPEQARDFVLEVQVDEPSRNL